MENKRGLSTIIASLLMVVLTFVAVGIIWVVIQNIVSEGAEGISLGSVTTNLQVKSVKINSGNIDVRIKREVGAGDLSGLKIIVSDGKNSQIFDQKIPMNELEEKTFNLAYSGIVKEVSVAPILKTSSGKEKTGSQTGNFVFTSQEAVRNMNGLVSWWRFDGNANDEMGRNNGNLNGGVDCNFQGRYGKACKFDGLDDYVSVLDDNSLDISQKFTFIFYVYIPSGGSPSLLNKWSLGPNWWNMQSYGVRGLQIFSNGLSSSIFTEQLYQYDSWSFVAFTYDSSISSNNAMIYQNGELVQTDTKTGSLSINNANFEMGRSDTTYYGKGNLDEVMIFNRSLSAEEIRSLYNLDLS